jgi:hypothetical protein
MAVRTGPGLITRGLLLSLGWSLGRALWRWGRRAVVALVALAVACVACVAEHGAIAYEPGDTVPAIMHLQLPTTATPPQGSAALLVPCHRHTNLTLRAAHREFERCGATPAGG